MAKKTNNKPQPAVAAKPAAAFKAEHKNQPEPVKSFSLTFTAKLCLILMGIALLVYANTLRNGYVLDDAVVSTNNSIVKQGFKGIPELLVTPRMKGVAYFKNDNYRPLSLVMFAAEYELFGNKPFIGHLFNILFFAGCVAMLFLFLDKLFDRKRTMLAFIATLLFALHPIHTEVVANIKSRDEILCFFFAFWSLSTFASYMSDGKIWRLILATITLFLSFISKETVITFLFIIPLVFFFYRNENRKRAIFITVGTLTATTAFLIIRGIVLSEYDTSTSAVEFIDNALAKAPTIWIRLATAILVLGKYVKLLILPYPLNNDYCYNSIPYVGFDNVWVLLSLALYLGMALIGIYRFIKDRRDPWAFGIFFYLATLSLFSNIPFLIGSEMGERFVFFASVGFCLVTGLAIEKWLGGQDFSYTGILKNKKVLAILIPVCLVFTGLTFARNSDWKDNYTLYKTDLEKSPNDCRLHFYLGNEMAENVYQKEPDTAKKRQILNDAIAYMKKGVAIYDSYPDLHSEIGKAYITAAQYDSAERYLKKSISLSPYMSLSANNLGTVYMRTGRFPEALTYYKMATTIHAGFAQAFYNTGCCYIQLKQYDSAIINFNIALALDPAYSDAYIQIGLTYFYAGNYAMAEPAIRKALEVTPNNPDAINLLGANYLNSGKLPQAVEEFKKAIAINRNYVNSYSNLGHTYFQMKQYEACIEAISKALQLDPTDVKDIPYIAMSYKGLGKMDLALKYEAIARQYFSNFKLE
jgi:tetratricopeptide (TPR) repeat protein